MRLSDSRDPNGIGTLILQHKGFDKKGWSLDLHAGTLFARVLDRNETEPDGLGAWYRDLDATGDITNSLIWPAATPPPNFGNLTRRIAGLSWAWSSMANVIGAASKGVGPAVLSPGREGMSPVRDKRMIEDPRYKVIPPWHPESKDGKRLWPKFPKGFYGVALAGANEEEQLDYFHPTDPRLIAVHREGDVEMGSLVCDMAPGFEIDPDRMARLQSAFRVIKDPSAISMNFHDENSIAWNLTESGCRDVWGGLVVDKSGSGVSGTKAGPTVTPDSRIVGAISQRSSGFLEVGSDNDQHVLGADADGNKIIATHLSTNSYHRRDAAFDGPLFFEGIWPGADTGPHRMLVHLDFDFGMQHPFAGGARQGQWRWWAESLIYSPDPVPPPVETPTSNPTVRPRGGPDGSNPGLVTEYTVETPAPQGALTGSVGATAKVRSWDPGDGAQRIGASTVEFGLPTILGRPNSYQSGSLDLRNALRLTASQVESVDSFVPIVARLEFFGRETQSGWTYTQSPGKSRYRGGTAAGGVAFLPPEIGMEEDGSDFAPAGRTLSTPYFVFGTGTYSAWGLPVRSTGAIKTGYRAGADTSGNLTWQSVNSSGTATDCFRLSSGAIAQISDGAGGWLPVLGGPTGGIGSGRIAFGASSGGNLVDDSAFVWNTTNNYLGVNQPTPAAQVDIVNAAGVPALKIDATTTPHTGTDGIIDINSSTSTNAMYLVDLLNTITGSLSGGAGVRSIVSSGAGSGGTGVGIAAFRAGFSSTFGSGANFVGYDIQTTTGYGGYGTSNGIMLFKYANTYSSSTTGLSAEYGIYLQQLNASVACTDSFRAIYIQRGTTNGTAAVTINNPFIECYLPISSTGGGTTSCSAQFIKMSVSSDANAGTTISGKMIEEILDGPISTGGAFTAYHVQDNGVTQNSTSALRGINIDFSASQVSVTGAILEGIKVALPAAYGNATEKGVAVSGDGRTVDLCTDSYAIDTSGDVYFSGRVHTPQGADVASANDLTLGTDSNSFEITGSTQINAITTSGWVNGDVVRLLFSGAPTVKYNTAGGAGTAVILLAGAVDFGATAGDTLVLKLSEIGGTQAWRELSRTAI